MGDEIAMLRLLCSGDCGEVSLANGCCRQIDGDVAVRRDDGLRPASYTAHSM